VGVLADVARSHQKRIKKTGEEVEVSQIGEAKGLDGLSESHHDISMQKNTDFLLIKMG